MIPTIPHIHKEPYSFSMEEEECDTSLSLGLGGIRWDKGNSIVRLGLNHDRWPHTNEEEKEEVVKRLKERFLNQSTTRKSNERKVVIADETNIGVRKKLRLTEEQSTVLESRFREHPTLNLAMKEDLAQRLGLRPRQVEVWFQNRRARTKLKKTEISCELMKRWCERLSEENQRLKRELQELRLTKAPPQPSTAMLSPVCLSCGQPVSGSESGSTGAVD